MRQTFLHFGHKPPSLVSITRMCKKGPNLIDSFYLLDPELRNLDSKTFNHWMQYYKDTYELQGTKLTTLYPGVRKLLTTLTEKNIECLIVSNKNAKSVKTSLDTFGILDIFSEIHGDTPAYPPKPNPLVFTDEILLNRPHLQRRDFLMIGDTQPDCEFAKACGIDMAWAEYGYGDISLCRLEDIKFRIAEPLDLVKVMFSEH